MRRWATKGQLARAGPCGPSLYLDSEFPIPNWEVILTVALGSHCDIFRKSLCGTLQTSRMSTTLTLPR